MISFSLRILMVVSSAWLIRASLEIRRRNFLAFWVLQAASGLRVGKTKHWTERRHNQFRMVSLKAWKLGNAAPFFRREAGNSEIFTIGDLTSPSQGLVESSSFHRHLNFRVCPCVGACPRVIYVDFSRRAICGSKATVS